MGLKTFVGGVHPYEGKELAKDAPIKEILPKGELVYPVSQHIGAPATPIVEKGDTLSSIAKKFNTTVSELKQLNDLTTDFIQVGQMLYISSPTSSTTYKTYTVVKGDTLWGIAKRYYGNGSRYPEIARANNIANPDIIHIGQKLLIP